MKKEKKKRKEREREGGRKELYVDREEKGTLLTWSYGMTGVGRKGGERERRGKRKGVFFCYLIFVLFGFFVKYYNIVVRTQNVPAAHLVRPDFWVRFFFALA